jgi:hypothetical protein
MSVMNRSTLGKWASALLLACVSVMGPTGLGAQTAAPLKNRVATSPLASRADLSVRARELEASATTGSRDDRERGMRELALVRSRLTEGDFRVGDRLLVVLTRDSAMADTAAVRDSMMVTIANLPDVSVRGVLRSELNDRLRDHVAKYIRQPEVRANVLTRVAISGGVGRPGFFSVPPDRPLTEMVMVAGGPVPGAMLDKIEITRGRTTYLRGRNAKRAVKEGRTLDELGVRSGDEIRIPIQKGFNWQTITQAFFAVSSITFGVVQIIGVTRTSRN